jgi:hypothetical protein
MVGSRVLKQSCWLAGVTWRLMGTVVAIACAFGAPFVRPMVFDPALRTRTRPPPSIPHHTSASRESHHASPLSRNAPPLDPAYERP